MTIADYLNISKTISALCLSRRRDITFGICHQSKNGMGEKTPEGRNYKTYEVSEMLGYREASYLADSLGNIRS